MRPGWDPRAERSACGIGVVADTAGRADRRVLDLALEALARVGHRGAVDADGVTGDGAGILTSVPVALLGEGLGSSADERAEGRLGVATIFSRGDATAVPAHVATACEAEGIELVGWRPVPTEPSTLGPAARATLPSIHHGILRPRRPWTGWAEERRAVHRARRRLERALDDDRVDATVVSLGFRTVTYKALVRAEHLARFYPDLCDERFTGWFALFHQRYSTNTSPGWERAQPFRMLAHNGEINTLRGNVERMRARQGRLGLGSLAAERLFAPVLDERGSDSAMLDEALELLTSEAAEGAEPRDVRHALAMLVPPASEHDPRLDDRRRAFHRWHETRLEPWDGPAALVFTDGRVVGAALDRNGLRPMRWSLGADGLFVCASEAGVVDHGPGAHWGRLGAGGIVAVDPAAGGLQLDPLEPFVEAAPYGAWLTRERGRGLVLAAPGVLTDPVPRQVAHGWTREHLALLVKPMASTGHEPTFSMGDDAPIPPLATHPRPVTDRLRQRFAQVTNPALDHLREGWVMSLRTFLGTRPLLLVREPAASPVVELPSFLLDGTPDGRRLDATWPADDGPAGLEGALVRLGEQACAAAAGGHEILVLDHDPSGPARSPVPVVLAVGAVHTALVEAGLRPCTSIVARADDVRDSHDAACLLTVGADAIEPRLALAAVELLHAEGRLPGVASAAEARRRYLAALEEGVRKALARLGISVLESYRGARALDALGLAPEVVDRCFPGVVSPLGGEGFVELGRDVLARHAAAFGPEPNLPNPGVVKHRRGGEHHATDPDVVRALHRAVDPGLTRLRSTASGGRDDEPAGEAEDPADLRAAHALRRAVTGGDPRAYARFAALVNGRAPTAPRDLLDLVPAGDPIPVDEVEDVEAILRRCSTGAISLGAISREAHETLALGTALAGSRSNSGEGGENPARFGDGRNSRIKQVASARFGVTPAYLASADELQIKIAQGSKPGEGGQLPGRKVTAEIAALRYAQPGIALLSPAPHHDIYSIEDLAQLVYDLKQVNPRAAVSVKLVAEAGVGTVAAGVAKAFADVVHVAGADGGTGASPLVSIRHAGMPWETGLAEVRQVLADQALRDRVRVRVDGGFRSGRDVVVAALLGADEFSFGSAALVAEGCLMVRSCHLDSCPVGIATQRPELRSRFAATPEMVATYLRFVAADVRRLLASLGLRSLEEAIGRTDLLRQVRHDGGLVLDELLVPRLDRDIAAHLPPQRPRSPLGDRVADESFPVLRDGGTAVRSFRIGNGDRAVGAALGGRAGRLAQVRGHVTCSFDGSAGQSFGAFLTDGIEFRLRGAANDGVGKGIGGGRVVVVPPPGLGEAPALIGNAALYGATGGELFVAGSAGDRFAVRNSGAVAVVEGLGANGCEYMTGGVVVVVGETGPNLGAGMTGGRAWVLDPDGAIDALTHDDVVVGEPSAAGDVHELLGLLRRHVQHTGSPRARALLDARAIDAFRLVVPREAAVMPGRDKPEPIPAASGA